MAPMSTMSTLYWMLKIGTRAMPRAIRRCGGAPVMYEPPYLMKPAVLDYRAHPLTFRAYARKLDG